ncbi:hypothetical protein [Bartonella sp. 220B]|uniref:hypothetical protein n=1 Tax=Bartonella sp. 220B TaxID=2967260 RepID=UPI0022A9413C|nr:hypothetical protein [Bartonella sp. 220B]
MREESLANKEERKRVFKHDRAFVSYGKTQQGKSVKGNQPVKGKSVKGKTGKFETEQCIGMGRSATRAL